MIAGERDVSRTENLKKLLETIGVKQSIIINSSSSTDHLLAEKTASELLKNVTSLKNLKDMVYRGIHIGVGIASSLISNKRCTSIDISKHMEEVHSYTVHTIFFLDSFIDTTHKKLTEKDTIYIYNGRHYNTYPQSLASEKQGYKIYYYERMNSWNNLKIQHERIHDFYSTSSIVKQFWEQSNDPNKAKIGELFYSQNKDNKFTKRFSQAVNINKKIISFFASSEDEFESLDTRITLSRIFTSQRAAVTWLMEWAKQQEEYELVIRLHPNQKNICPLDYDYWHNLKGKNTTIISSDSNLDTYSLISNSNKVLSYLSTVGIEATRMGVPSITLGLPIYSGLDAVYEPKNIKELEYMINNDIKPKDINNTLPYGYYTLEYGPKLRFMEKMKLVSFENYPELLS